MSFSFKFEEETLMIIGGTFCCEVQDWLHQTWNDLILEGKTFDEACDDYSKLVSYAKQYADSLEVVKEITRLATNHLLLVQKLCMKTINHPTEGITQVACHKDTYKLACISCGISPKTKLFKCGRCEITRYCSKECQKNHWKEHKKFCCKL